MADVLAAALGPRYEIATADAETVVVASTRTKRADVRVVRRDDRTELTVKPTGFVAGVGVARTVARVLQRSAELRMPG